MSLHHNKKLCPVKWAYSDKAECRMLMDSVPQKGIAMLTMIAFTINCSQKCLKWMEYTFLMVIYIRIKWINISGKGVNFFGKVPTLYMKGMIRNFLSG